MNSLLPATSLNSSGRAPRRSGVVRLTAQARMVLLANFSLATTILVCIPMSRRIRR